VQARGPRAALPARDIDGTEIDMATRFRAPLRRAVAVLALGAAGGIPLDVHATSAGSHVFRCFDRSWLGTASDAELRTGARAIEADDGS